MEFFVVYSDKVFRLTERDRQKERENEREERGKNAVDRILKADLRATLTD